MRSLSTVKKSRWPKTGVDGPRAETCQRRPKDQAVRLSQPACQASAAHYCAVLAEGILRGCAERRLGPEKPVAVRLYCHLSPDEDTSLVISNSSSTAGMQIWHEAASRPSASPSLSPVVRPSTVLGSCAALFAPARIRSGAYPMDGTRCWLLFRIYS